MKKIQIIIVLLFIQSVCFSQEIYFKLNKDVTAKGGNIDSPEYRLLKGTEIAFDYNYKYYLNFNEDKYYFCIQGKYNDEKLKFNGDDIIFRDYKNYSISNFESLWCMSYYYASLKNNDVSLIQQKTEYMESDRGTELIFQPLFFKFGNSYIGAQSSIRRDYGAISRILEYKNEMVVFEILSQDCGIKELKEKLLWEPAYKRLYEENCPYKLFVLFDGDFAKVYINSVSDDNFLFELARVDMNTINQISNYVKTGKYDSTNINWPKHNVQKIDYKKVETTTNVSPNKTMTVKENLKLRSGEATSTQVLTVMQAGTKVKILELGKAEKIDGISSNWVKVEVQSDAKDRDGKAIKAGTIGWCYGGYLK